MMLQDMWAVGASIPGVGRRLAEVGELLCVDLVVEEPEELTTLFPNVRIRDGDEKSHELLEKIRAMAERWSRRSDGVNAAALSELEQQAEAGGLRWPRLTPRMAEELVARPGESLERLGGEMVSRSFGVATGVSQPV